MSRKVFHLHSTQNLDLARDPWYNVYSPRSLFWTRLVYHVIPVRTVTNTTGPGLHRVKSVDSTHDGSSTSDRLSCSPKENSPDPTRQQSILDFECTGDLGPQRPPQSSLPVPLLLGLGLVEVKWPESIRRKFRKVIEAFFQNPTLVTECGP